MGAHCRDRLQLSSSCGHWRTSRAWVGGVDTFESGSILLRGRRRRGGITGNGGRQSRKRSHCWDLTLPSRHWGTLDSTLYVCLGPQATVWPGPFAVLGPADGPRHAGSQSGGEGCAGRSCKATSSPVSSHSASGGDAMEKRRLSGKGHGGRKSRCPLDPAAPSASCKLCWHVDTRFVGFLRWAWHRLRSSHEKRDGREQPRIVRRCLFANTPVLYRKSRREPRLSVGTNSCVFLLVLCVLACSTYCRPTLEAGAVLRAVLCAATYLTADTRARSDQEVAPAHLSSELGAITLLYFFTRRLALLWTLLMCLTLFQQMRQPRVASGATAMLFYFDTTVQGATASSCLVSFAVYAVLQPVSFFALVVSPSTGTSREAGHGGGCHGPPKRTRRRVHNGRRAVSRAARRAHTAPRTRRRRRVPYTLKHANVCHAHAHVSRTRTHAPRP